MKISLVQCPAWAIEGPPYALALLLAALRKSGHEARCFDLNAEIFASCREEGARGDCAISELSWSTDYRGTVWYDKESVLTFMDAHRDHIERLTRLILDESAPVIGFSVQSSSKFFSLELACRIKEMDRERTIIFGGPLCFRNCYGIDILKDCEFLDYVCFGEGEECLPRLLDAMDKKGDVGGCAGFGRRLKDGTIIDAGNAEPIKDLDKIPFADYSDFALETYTKRQLAISTSRGCINRCTFCNESPQWGRYRRRSAKGIFDEMRYQSERYPGTEMFWFNDSLFNGDIKTLRELCGLLIAGGVRRKWRGQAMIRGEMDGDLLGRMRLSGCAMISYGIENGSDKILKTMRKGYTTELAEEVIRRTFRADIPINLNLITGFPDETGVEFGQNKGFVNRCRDYTDVIAVNTLLLMKGSYIYDNLDEFNIAPIDYDDPEWQLRWRTRDGSNTYEVREKRRVELMEVIGEAALRPF